MESQLKILLAGFGDIAARLANRLVENNIRSVVVKRSALDASLPVQLKQGDLKDAQFVEGLFADQFDVVVVTMTPGSFTDEGYREAYVAVAENLLKAIEQSAVKPKLVIWVSSTSVYGLGDGSWVDEQTPPEPVSFSAKRLLQAEQIIEQLPVDSCIVRFSGIYGPGRNRMIDQLKKGSVAAAEPTVWSNRIHSEDCAAVLEHLIQRYQNGQQIEPLYIATDNKPSPISEVHRWLTQQLGIKIIDETAPPARANRRCSNKLLLASGFEFKYGDYQAGYKAILASTEP